MCGIFDVWNLETSRRTMNNNQIITRKASPYIWQHIDYNVLILNNIISIGFVIIKKDDAKIYLYYIGIHFVYTCIGVLKQYTPDKN